MDIEELKIKVNEAIAKHEYILVEARICSEPDPKGLRKLLKERDIDALFIENGTLVPTRKVEVFIKLNDKELGKEAKKVFYKEWGVEIETQH